ncbi:MAG: hypothetical protein U0L18_00070 [Acutalibacteraceae bacterium]|nr:hypothetical protein [Acutalibacteraceae bacterium]
MKKVHLYFCFVLWALWLIGILLLGLCHLIFNLGGNENFFFWHIAEPYNSFMILFYLLPIEPIMFVIALIAEIPKWKRKSFLTVVLPFFATVIFWLIYLGLFVAGTGGV